MYLKDDKPYTTNVWNTKLQQYLHEGQIPEKIYSLIEHIKLMKTETSNINCSVMVQKVRVAYILA